MKLCELIQETGTSPAAFERALANLVARYGQALALGSKELPQILKILDRKLTAVGNVHGVRVFTSPLMKNIGLLAAQGERTVAPAATGGTVGLQKAAAELQPKEILLGGVAEVAQLMATRPVDFDRILEAARRCVQSALKLTQCMAFLKDAGGLLLSARVGDGAVFDQIRGRPLLDPTKADVFHAALTKGDDVLIQNSNDPKVWPLIPDWLRAAGRNRTLILLPIRAEEGTFALIVGVSELLLPLELAAQLKQQSKFLRDNVAFVRSMA